MKNNKISYDKICTDWTNHRNKSVINQCIVDFSKLLKPECCILDIGCGSGYPIDYYLINNGFKVIGIDISSNMIKQAKNLNLENAYFFNCDFLDFESDIKFDAIIAFDSLWHISENNQISIYSKLASLINTDGYLLFTHGKNKGSVCGKMFNETFYYTSLDYKNVLQLLKENGFCIISSFLDYEEKTTGSRELLVIARKI